MKETIKKIIIFILRLPGNIIVLPVKLYRKYVSPYKGANSCRFNPTCSKYALDAVGEWGALIGAVLTLWRILRCNPFCKGGYDPVPNNPVREYFRRGKNKTGDDNRASF